MITVKKGSASRKLPRDLAVGDVVQRRDPRDGSRSEYVRIQEVRKELGQNGRYIVFMQARPSWGGLWTYKLAPRSREYTFEVENEG